MATLTSPKAGFEKWQDGIDNSIENSRWNVYDCEIQIAVNEYNHHLSSTPGYRKLDWRLIKAMIWVETGARSKKWESNPIQIGNPGDPGLNALLSGNEGGNLIIPPAWKNRLTTGTASTIPSHNIRAGTGYLLMRLANYAVKSVLDADHTIYESEVQTGDGLSSFAKKRGTTVDIIRKFNRITHSLKPGQKLKYQKASLKKVITGWKSITTSSISTSYNVGDPLYARKLDYALTLICKKKTPACTL